MRGRGMLLCNLVPTLFRQCLAIAPRQADRTSCGRGLGEGDTWPPHLISEGQSRSHQPACRRGLPPQPPQNEAMEHQGQRNGEGGHHDQRIGCDEKVRRLECKNMRPSGRGHCPHGDCHDEVGDSKKAPSVCCPVRANYVSCLQRSHDATATMPVVTSPIPAGSANCQGRRPSAQSTRKRPPATRYTSAAT